MSDKKWKDYLLKSGVPLEFEIKNVLTDAGFIHSYEFSYLRNDENNIENEFSYDLDFYNTIDDHVFELMIECKYRDPSTNWVFIPEEYNLSSRGIGANDYLNTNDTFYKKRYSDFFRMINFKPIASLCSKGIEICSTGSNPKSIKQAVKQLSYALPDKVIAGIEKQLHNKDLNYPDNAIFHHIPIIVTTANLYRLNENASIEDILKANEIDEVAEQKDLILLEPPIGKDLEKYSKQKYKSIVKKYGKHTLCPTIKSNLNSKPKNVKRHLMQLAKELPRGILIIQHKKDNSGFEKLFNILPEFANLSEETKKFIKDLPSQFEAAIAERT